MARGPQWAPGVGAPGGGADGCFWDLLVGAGLHLSQLGGLQGWAAGGHLSILPGQIIGHGVMPVNVKPGLAERLAPRVAYV